MRPLRPSQFGQAVHCGLSAHAPLDRPEQENLPAREGTCAAWVAELVLNGDASSPLDLIGRSHANGVVVDEEMVKHVTRYIEVLPPNGQAECFEETEFMQGTADHRALLSAAHLQITDLKYGYTIVEAVKNWQLLCYLWLYVSVHGHYPENVTLAVYQPRAIHEQGPLRKWHLTRDEYEPLMAHISNRIMQIVGGDDTANVGGHCMHCLNAVGCQALTQSVYKITEVATASRVYHQPSAEELGDELEMLRFMDGLLKARLRAVEEEAVYRISHGGFMPKWVIKPRKGKKKFTVEAGMIEMLTGVKATEEKLVTPAELLRRNADPKVVAQITTVPNIGQSLEPYAGEEKVAAQFRAAKLS